MNNLLRRYSRTELIAMIEHVAKKVETPKGEENERLCKERDGFQIIELQIRKGKFKDGKIEWSLGSDANWSFSPGCPRKERLMRLSSMVQQMYERLNGMPHNLTDAQLVELAEHLGIIAPPQSP